MIWIFKNFKGEYFIFKSRDKKKPILTLYGSYSLDSVIRFIKLKLHRKSMRIYFYNSFAGAVAYQKIQQRNKFKLIYCYNA